MLQNVLLPVLLVCFFALTACSDDDNAICGHFAIIDVDRYETIQTEGYAIISHQLVGDCLTFTIGASGCDGSSFEASLVSTYGISISEKVHYLSKIDFLDNEDCEAYITKKFDFDLSPLQGGDFHSETIISLEGYSEQIIYTY